MFSRVIGVTLFFLAASHLFAQKSVDIRQFGAVGRGSDDSSVLREALSRTNKGVLSIPAGVVVNANTYFDVPSGVSIEGGGKLVGVKLRIGSNTTISGLTFEGTQAGIHVEPSQQRSNDTIQNNTFRGVNTAIRIPGTRTGPAAHDITVSGNTCESCTIFMHADKVDHSTFANNIIHAEKWSLLFFGGANNRILSNQVDGGITGISFIYQFTEGGENDFVSGNIIQGNHIVNVREEAISFDVRGNEPPHTAVREVDRIAGKSDLSVTLAGPKWTGQGQALHQLYLCWMTGGLEGTCIRSTGGSDANFQLNATTDQMQKVNVGDQAVLGAPFLSNAVYKNDIQIDPQNTKASGILLWGLSYDNVICGNKVSSPTPVSTISAIGVVSLNGLDQRQALTFTPGGRKAPSENNLIANNEISNLRLQVGYKDWGNQVHYSSKGNLLFQNTMTEGTVDVKDQVNSHGASVSGAQLELADPLPEPLQKTIASTGGSGFCRIPIGR